VTPEQASPTNVITTVVLDNIHCQKQPDSHWAVDPSNPPSIESVTGLTEWAGMATTLGGIVCKGLNSLGSNSNLTEAHIMHLTRTLNSTTTPDYYGVSAPIEGDVSTPGNFQAIQTNHN